MFEYVKLWKLYSSNISSQASMGFVQLTLNKLACLLLPQMYAHWWWVMEPYESELEGRSESSHPIKPTAAWVIEPLHGHPCWDHMCARGHRFSLWAATTFRTPLEPGRTPLPNPDAVPQSGGRSSPMLLGLPDTWLKHPRLLPEIPCAWFPIPSPPQMFISEFLLGYLLSLTELVLCHIFSFYYQNNKMFKVL